MAEILSDATREFYRLNQAGLEQHGKGKENQREKPQGACLILACGCSDKLSFRRIPVWLARLVHAGG
jgi:hypothetical protein